MPSKTFHFGPDFEQVVLDLFESHLQLTALLEVATSSLAEEGTSLPAAQVAIARADRQWSQLWRHYWVYPPNSN